MAFYTAKRDMIGYKVCKNKAGNKYYIVTLVIPKRTEYRASTDSRGKKNLYSKHRTARAIPIQITRVSAKCSYGMIDYVHNNVPENPFEQKITHRGYREIVYELDEVTLPDSFDRINDGECSNGVHYFTKPELALKYIRSI